MIAIYIDRYGKEIEVKEDFRITELQELINIFSKELKELS